MDEERIKRLEKQVDSLALSSLQKEAKFIVLNLMLVSLLKELAENGTVDGPKLAAPFLDRAEGFLEKMWGQLAFPDQEDPAGFTTDSITADQVTEFTEEIVRYYIAALNRPSNAP